MKNLFQTIVNLLLFLHYVVGYFFLIIWYGKLPKVSIYHTQVGSYPYEFKEQFEDVNAQVKKVEDVPTYVKRLIIDKYIDELYKDERFKANIQSLDIPLFDGKEIVGRGSVINIFIDVKQKIE